MASTIDWPDIQSLSDPIDQLAALSQYYGRDPEHVLAGGGNTSVKIGDRLHVKGSGTSLAEIGRAGFVEMERNSIEALLETFDPKEAESDREERFKQAVLSARIHPELGQRPSVECALHNVLPGKFVLHTHPTWINMVTCATNGQSIAAELFDDDVLWIPYTTAGFVLAAVFRTLLDDYRARTGNDTPYAVLMGNHGFIVSGDTPEILRERTDMLLDKVRGRVGTLPETAFGLRTPRDDASKVALVRTIAPMLRALLANNDALKIVTFDDSSPIDALVEGAEGEQAAMGGALIPDQIVYCKSLPLWVDPADGISDTELVQLLRDVIETYTKEHGFPPHVVLVKGVGMFSAGNTYKDAATVHDVYRDQAVIMAGARQLGGINPMTVPDRKFIENWEVEHYRQKVLGGVGAAGRATGKVVVVTGAAQGFGLEIARDIAAEGGHVVLADLNTDGVTDVANALIDEHGIGRAMGLELDVTKADSIRATIDAVIRQYGGFDTFISNAGVLKAGSVKDLPESDFDFVTQVNYKGYFLCVQQATPVLALQHLARPTYRSDIIQINSKSGLEGSSRNAAYAGSKFGAIGLTQSFALELAEDGIKVNAVCPGNFLDGSLWSDPDHGLFVQYLRSGKVPGAKTIDDVRHAYEAKVPMGRGCTPGDVMKAIYYLIEQDYETGQALPVTGGQVMLP